MDSYSTYQSSVCVRVSPEIYFILLDLIMVRAVNRQNRCMHHSMIIFWINDWKGEWKVFFLSCSGLKENFHERYPVQPFSVVQLFNTFYSREKGSKKIYLICSVQVSVSSDSPCTSSTPTYDA